MTPSGGTAPYTFSVVGTLPAGLTLNTSTGAVTGTPTAAGNFSIKVTDANGSTDTATCTITVVGSPVKLSCGACSTSGKGTAGSAYNSSFTATGGSYGYTYSIISGSLPAGLSLNPSTGAVTGTPTTPGTYTFTAKVVDGKGNSDTASCSITVIGSAVTLACGTCGAGNGQIGQTYDVYLKASGGIGSYTYSASGLPSWLSLNATTGELKGTPSASGTFTFTTTVVDSKGNTDKTTCTIQVNAPQLDLQCGSCSAGNAKVHVAYSVTLTTTGGAGGYTYAIVSGSLPTGLTMTSAGKISGTPTKEGFYAYTVKVTDSAKNTDTKTCYIQVGDGCQ